MSIMEQNKRLYFGRGRNIAAARRGKFMLEDATAVITLCLRYTIDPSRLDDFAAYASAGQIPIRESGGQIVGRSLPTDFAGETKQAHSLTDFASLAGYEIYRAKLAEHPLQERDAAGLEKSGCVLSTHRSLVRRAEPPKDMRP